VLAEIGAGRKATGGMMRITILGCGGSNGVPTIGNRWGVCDPANPRNRRLRASVLVEVAEQAILIDTTPDLREQLLAARVEHLDAVLYSHGHADHTHGIDDLREINRLMERPLPVYADGATLRSLGRRFGYCFRPLNPGEPYYRPVLVPHVIWRPFWISNKVEVFPFRQDHGYSFSLGFRFGSFAYSTDVLDLDEAALKLLEGIRLWVVDCCRETPHPVHAHLEKILAWVERLRPRQVYLTHLSNRMDYESLCQRLPFGIAPAYDGQVIDVPSGY
jgi:phosphoribosyl 1,2-cyclic phosphate phosphodiesterase